MHTAIIADDHPFIRSIVRNALQQAAVEVVCEACDGVEVLQQVRAHQPDLLVLDLDMPRMGGLDVLGRLMEMPRRPKVLILSGHPPEHFAARCMRAGAASYLCKRHGLAHLTHALAAMRGGFIYFPEEVNVQVPVQPDKTLQAAMVATLAPREMQVLRYLGLGMSNEAIGDQMHISNKTVSTHKRRLLKKFQVKSVIDLAAIVRRYGLI